MNGDRGARLAAVRWRWMPLWVFLLAVILRVIFLGEVQDDPVYRVPGHDESVNDTVARAILAGGMPSAPFYKAPLYMYSLAGVYRMLGPDAARARWVQVVVFAVPAVLLALIARRLFGETVGIVAGVIGAIYWGFVFYTTELVDTSMAAVFYLLLGYLLVSLPGNRRTTWVLCGMVLGLGTITRPNVAAAAPLLVLAIFYEVLWRCRSAPDGPIPLAHRAWETGRRVVLFGLGAGAVIAPVTLHNWVVGGEFVPIATYGGLNAWSANSPWSNGKDGSVILGPEKVREFSVYDANDLWCRLDLNLNLARSFAEQKLGHPVKTGEADRFLYESTLGYMRENPRKLALDTLKRFCWFFNGHDYCNLKDMYRVCRVSWTLRILSYLHWGVFCPLAVLGVIFSLQMRPKPAGLIYYLVMLSALFAGGLLFVMHSRFRLPTIYLSMPFAAYGLVTFIARVTRPGAWGARVGYPVLLGLLAVFSNINWFGYSVSGHTELQFTYAQACLQTNRTDLLPDATRSFEEAYSNEMHHGGMPWANSLYCFNPPWWIFRCYHRLGEESKAIEWIPAMLERDPLSSEVVSLVKGLIGEKSAEPARILLNQMEQRTAPGKRGRLAELLITYCNTFHDKPVLTHTAKLLLRALREHPNDDRMRGLHALVIRRIMTPTTESRPTGTAPASTHPGASPGVSLNRGLGDR
jgi:hypothetical protein